MNSIYRGSQIHVRTESFGNGAAAEVLVDGEKVLDIYNSLALCATVRAAVDKGFRFGRQFIDAKRDAPSQKPSEGES